jgi:sugar lactone lactonase YvrE
MHGPDSQKVFNENTTMNMNVFQAAADLKDAHVIFTLKTRGPVKVGANGLCFDGDGNLWIAFWGAGQVRCFSPAGVHLATVEVPAHTRTVPWLCEASLYEEIAPRTATTGR